MVSVNELRIGNLLKDETSGAILRVEFVSHTGYKTFVIDRSKYPLPLGWQTVGIPLTPELLEKCGLGFGHPQLVNEDTVVTIVDMLMVHKHDNGSVSLSVVFMSMPDSYKGKPIRKAEIKYLHQLQNLHFALTGEELPISL